MTVAELALQKIFEFSEDYEKELLNVELVTVKKLVPEKCEANGDVLTLGFSDGTEQYLTVRDCNTSYSETGLTETVIVSEDIFDFNGKYMKICSNDIF